MEANCRLLRWYALGEGFCHSEEEFEATGSNKTGARTREPAASLVAVVNGAQDKRMLVASNTE